MTTTKKGGNFNSHSAIKCSHCGQVFFHGAHCGCKDDQKARGVWTESTASFKGATLEF